MYKRNMEGDIEQEVFGCVAEQATTQTKRSKEFDYRLSY